MKINKISLDTKNNILRKTAYSLPDNPSEAGMTSLQIKEAFYRGIIDSENALTSEIDRVVEEANLSLDTKSDLTLLSNELVLKKDKWNNSFQVVEFDVNKKMINEIYVLPKSLREWSKYGIIATEEISKEESENYGIKFTYTNLPNEDLYFKVLSYFVNES